MTPTKPNLDEDSARKIARGQIPRALENFQESIKSLKLPPVKKRGQWLRSVEEYLRQFYGVFVLSVIVEKRSLTTIFLFPADVVGRGWLQVFSYFIRYRGNSGQLVPVAGISEHAIAQVMVRTREVDALGAIRAEFLGWAAVCLSTCTYTDKDEIFVPSASGVFIASLDEAMMVGDRELIVLKTWISELTLNEKERAALKGLRQEKQVGVGRDWARR